MGETDDDLLDGVAAIAAHLKMKPRRVRHLIATAGLPAFTLGERSVAARKSSLNRWLAECEAKARAGRP